MQYVVGGGTDQRPARLTPALGLHVMQTPRAHNGFAYVEADGSQSTASWEGISGGEMGAMHQV